MFRSFDNIFFNIEKERSTAVDEVLHIMMVPHHFDHCSQFVLHHFDLAVSLHKEPHYMNHRENLVTNKENDCDSNFGNSGSKQL